MILNVIKLTPVKKAEKVKKIGTIGKTFMVKAIQLPVMELQ